MSMDLAFLLLVASPVAGFIGGFIYAALQDLWKRR